MQDLLSYVLPYAEQNKMPVENIIFRCFLYIERNAGLLSRYNTLIAAEGATPQARQTINQQIALRIEKALGLERVEEIQLPQGFFLINNYAKLKEKEL